MKNRMGFTTSTKLLAAGINPALMPSPVGYVETDQTTGVSRGIITSMADHVYDQAKLYTEDQVIYLLSLIPKQ